MSIWLKPPSLKSSGVRCVCRYVSIRLIGVSRISRQKMEQIMQRFWLANCCNDSDWPTVATILIGQLLQRFWLANCRVHYKLMGWSLNDSATANPVNPENPENLCWVCSRKQQIVDVAWESYIDTGFPFVYLCVTLVLPPLQTF